MSRVATTLVDLYLLSHALARFELKHQGFPVVEAIDNLGLDLVPHYLSAIPGRDPWDRPYAYQPHKVLVQRPTTTQTPITDSYELSAKVVSPRTGELIPVRVFNGTFVEAPLKIVIPVLSLRKYARYPGPAADTRQALKMFGLARPLELAKWVAIRIIEDLGDPRSIPHLKRFIGFNEPERLRQVARDAVARHQQR